MFLLELHEFPSAPCFAKKKKILMTARVSMLLKSRASLTRFRACLLPDRAKDLSTPLEQSLSRYLLTRSARQFSLTVQRRCVTIKLLRLTAAARGLAHKYQLKLVAAVDLTCRPPAAYVTGYACSHIVRNISPVGYFSTIFYARKST